MKKGLPKFLLITDPYDGLIGRILIFKTQFPKYIFELNRDDDEDSQTINVFGKDYRIAVRKNFDSKDEIKISELSEAVRWYHFSKSVSKESN